MSQLIEIADEERALDKLLDDCDGDVTGMEQIIDEWRKEIGDNLNEKVDSYAALITEKMRMYGVRQGESERLHRLALTDKNRADSLKGWLKYILDDMCIKKLETDRFRVSVAANGGKKKLDIFVPDNMIPNEYQKQSPPVPDTEKIREALEAGSEIPGAVLQERGTSLRIR